MPHWLSAFDTRLRRLDLRFWQPGLHKYLHYGNWFRKELAGYLGERLTDLTIHQSQLWNRTFLDHVVRDHTDGRKNYLREINAVLTLEAIERLFFHQPVEMKQSSERIDTGPCRRS